ncbi:unnamed protein product [Diamesa tonsa]
MTKLGIYLVTWICVCVTITTALSDIHHRMSPSQLQEIFHVDDKELVPNYEVVKLVHQSTNHHIDKRSINSNNLFNNDNSFSVNSNKFSDSVNNSTKIKNKNNHHVKKDLSKIPFADKSANNGGLNDAIVGPPRDIPADVNVNFKDYDLKSVKQHNVSFSAFGELLNLTLKPTEGLFKNGPNSLKMWHVRPDANASQGLFYEKVEEVSVADDIGDIFQDQENMAAILMRKHLQSGDLLMEGSIGHQLIIRPVPLDVSKADDGSVHHVVYKRETTPEMEEGLSDFAYMEPDRMQKRYRRSAEEVFAEQTEANSRNKRAIPHVIYPEILVIVDYDGYRLHGGDNIQIKRYFVSFWNGVDLRYRLLKGPKIRISIAGIIISRGRDATPYLERNRVGRDAIDSAAALTDMGKYLFRERRLPVYDIAVAITKLDMCRRQYANDACNRGTAGFAYVGGACVVNKRLEKVNSVAIIEDTGGFSGIIVAAHEVGHLLGAVHDGSPPPSYLGGPGAEKCRWEDGYIMSDLRHTERGFRWSPCSVQSFHHFLNGDTASCLHNAPHEDEALGRQLPGTLLSLDAQCRRDRGTSACFKDERVCAQLFCFDAASGYCVAYRPAAEGSPCGDGQHCLDGRCVAEHENIIPDYSQHTPSYASPNSFGSQFKNEFKNVYEDDESSTTETTTRLTTTTTKRTTTTRATTTTSKPTTTRSTTTTTTTQRSTTVAQKSPASDELKTPKTYFSNSFYHNKNNNNINGQTTKSPFKFVVNLTTKTPTVFNAFAYGSTKSVYTTTTKAPSTIDTTAQPKINPFYFGFNRLNTNTSNLLVAPPATTQSSNNEVDNNIYENQSQYDQTAEEINAAAEAAKPKSSTYNPVFDIYFRQIGKQKTTSRKPYQNST